MSAFDRYYFQTHVPLAKKIPLRKYEVSAGPVMTLAGPSQIHLIADSTDDLSAIQKGFW